MKYRKTKLQIEKVQMKQWLADTAGKHIPAHVTFTAENLVQLEDEIQGKIVYPWSPGYEEDRKDFNDVYPAYPEMIIYVACYNDVKLALQFAHDFDLWTVVRSGGHSLAGYSVNNGMVIDISNLNSIYVNTVDNTAFIEAGNQFQNIFPKIEDYGLHMPGGGCPTVSVAGYMQGGGFGLTSRNFGMNLDCVLEITVMLADGTLVVANADNAYADLFWAVRGGTGGNFGVLLSIKYQLYPLWKIWGIKIYWTLDESMDNCSNALYQIQNNYLTTSVYPNLGIETVLTTDNDGKKKVMFNASWIGSEESMNEALQPLLTAPGAVEMGRYYGKYSYVNDKVLEGTPDLPMDVKAYSRSTYIARSLDIGEWKSILEFFRTAPNQYTMIDMECYGGAINAVSPDKCAFIHRDVHMDFFCDAFFNKETNDQQKNEEWLEALFEFMKAFSNGHSYQNYNNRNQTDYKWAYWGNSYQKLVQIKRKYDPDNFFHYQQSIDPEDAEELHPKHNHPNRTNKR